MVSEMFILFLKAHFNSFIDEHKEEIGKTAQDIDAFLFQIFFDPARRRQIEQSYRLFEAQHQMKTGYSGNQQKKQTHKPNTSPPAEVNEKKYYDALEIAPTNNWEEIKNAYKQVMKKYHPDRFYNDEEKQALAKQLTQIINEAYQYFEKKFAK